MAIDQLLVPDAENQYASITPPGGGTPRTPEYDQRGNLRYSDTSLNPAIGTIEYRHAWDNRLWLVRQWNGSTWDASPLLAFHDALGRRTESRVNGVWTQLIHDGDRVIEERNGNHLDTATLARSYAFGDYLDEPVAMIDEAPGSGGTIHYYLHDRRYSVVALVYDDNGATAVAESYAYTSFGLTTIYNSGGAVIPSSALGNTTLFTGRRYDHGSQTYDYRARNYLPELGRFLQRDPAGYIDGYHLYAYVGNNPLRYVDIFGLYRVDLGGGTALNFTQTLNTGNLVFEDSFGFGFGNNDIPFTPSDDPITAGVSTSPTPQFGRFDPTLDISHTLVASSQAIADRDNLHNAAVRLYMDPGNAAKRDALVLEAYRQTGSLTYAQDIASDPARAIDPDVGLRMRQQRVVGSFTNVSSADIVGFGFGVGVGFQGVRTFGQAVRAFADELAEEAIVALTGLPIFPGKAKPGNTPNATATKANTGSRPGSTTSGGQSASLQISNAPSDSNLRFTQTTASPRFSIEGTFNGRSIADVANDLATGRLRAADVPVEVVRRGDSLLIVNTRSSLALKQAGIPPSQWSIIDRTGDALVEQNITERLLRNKLGDEGVDALRITGQGSGASTLRSD